MEASAKGSVIKIAWTECIENENQKLCVDVTPFCDMLEREEVKDLPVVIYSINGRMRTGKSFLLNMIVKYLTKNSNSHENWMDTELQNGFICNNDTECVTNGIQMWSEPIIVDTGNGKTAVFLMDTQGAHDKMAELVIENKIFGLSALLSSVFIHNDKVMSNDIFNVFNDFLEFTKSAEVDGREESRVSNDESFQFGKLIFLQRDWQHHQKIPYGYCDSNHENFAKWKDMFWGNQTKDSQQLRSSISSSFSDLAFFAMAGPGNKHPDDDTYKLSTSWNKKFRATLVQFIEAVFNPSYINGAEKHVSGNKIVASNFARHVKTMAKIMEKNEYTLSHISPLGFKVELYYRDIIWKSKNYYKKDSEKFLSNVSFSHNPDDFHVATIEKIKMHYWATLMYRNKQTLYFDRLKNKLKPLLAKNKKEAQTKKRGKLETICTVGGVALVTTYSGGVVFAIMSVTVVVDIIVGAACGAVAGYSSVSYLKPRAYRFANWWFPKINDVNSGDNDDSK